MAAMRKFCASIILLGMLGVSSVHAETKLVDKENFKLTLQGYYKNLFFTSNDLVADTRYYGDTNRLRMDWDMKAWDWLSAKLMWDNEIIVGNYVQTFDFQASESLREQPDVNLYYNLVQKKNFFYGQNLYRAYVKVNPKQFSLSAGRQRINWGVARLLSPLDLYTPLATFSLEPSETVGLDSANLVIPITPKTKLNAAYSINRRFDLSRTGLRLTQTIGRFDVSVLGGRFLQDWIAGADFTGDIGGVGIRGELMYDHAAFGKKFAQLTLGMDYGFANSLTLVAEYFYNGQATDTFSPTFFLTPQPTANQIQTQHSQFIALSAKYDILPILTPSLFFSWDILGSSVFVRPEIKYSVLSWMDLTAFAQLPMGRSGGDFTSLPNLYAFQLQMFY